MLDATIRDINIDFKNDYINVLSKAVVLTNDIIMKAKIVNKPQPPVIVEDVNVQMEELNLNVISDALNDFEADSTRNKHQQTANTVPISAEQVIIKMRKLMQIKF